MPSIRLALLVPLIAAAVVATPPAAAQLPGVTVSGNIEVIPAPVSVSQGALESLDRAFLFGERARVTLAAQLQVDIATPGEYNRGTLPNVSTIPAGAIISSYYGHFDTFGTGGAWRHAIGSISFSQQILGIAVLEDSLAHSDFLGSPGTTYTVARELDFSNLEAPDRFTLEADLRTVSFDLQTLPLTDDFRIFVGEPVIHATVNSATSATLQAIGLQPVAAAWGLSKEGSGTLTLDQESPFAGPTRVTAGTLVVTGPATLSMSDVSVSDTARLVLSGGGDRSLASLTLAQSGLLDLGTGSLTVARGITPAQAQTAVLQGRGDGTWNGTTGITSSAVATDIVNNRARSVGWKDNADGTVTFAYAAPGDTNLDGQVNVFDLVEVRSAGQFGTGAASVWSEGDFDSNGVTNIFDLVLANGAGVYGTGGYRPDSAAAMTVSPVPEPGHGALLAAGLSAVGLFRLRGQRAGRVRGPTLCWDGVR